MSTCPHTKGKHCQCQPQDGVMCAFGPQPPFALWPDEPDIRAIFLAHGFTIKEGQTDLKPYVYEAARALLAAYRDRSAA